MQPYRYNEPYPLRLHFPEPVSYTHLDVYKRQHTCFASWGYTFFLTARKKDCGTDQHCKHFFLHCSHSLLYMVFQL